MNDVARQEKFRGEAVLCPKCRKPHYSSYGMMDEFIYCECGFRFYAFVDHGLRIMMTPGEASYEPVARAMRRFVVSTGRCTDIPPELYTDSGEPVTMEIHEQNLCEELERTLEQFQMTVFGECYLTRELVISMCEMFQKGHDVELRKQKNRIDLIKLIRKKVTGQTIKQHHWVMTDGSEMGDISRMGCPQGGIMMLSQESEKNITQ